MGDNLEDDYWNTSLSSRFDFDEEEVEFLSHLHILYKQKKNFYRKVIS